MRRFGGGNRNERKQTIIEKILKFFEKYFGIFDNKETKYSEDEEYNNVTMVAEDEEKYNQE